MESIDRGSGCRPHKVLNQKRRMECVYRKGYGRRSESGTNLRKGQTVITDRVQRQLFVGRSAPIGIGQMRNRMRKASLLREQQKECQQYRNEIPGYAHGNCQLGQIGELYMRHAFVRACKETTEAILTCDWQAIEKCNREPSLGLRSACVHAYAEHRKP